MKKKILKSILTIILVIVICVVIFVARKVTILSKLDKSVCTLEDTKDNIYIKIDNTGHSYHQSSSELFIKGDIEKMIIKKHDGNATLMQFIYPTERKVYMETKEGKYLRIEKEIATKRTTDITSAQTTRAVIVNFASNESFLGIMLLALNTGIREVEIDGKDCYELYGMHCPNFIYGENSISMSAYVEKETGLPVKLVETIQENGETKECITKYEVKFDCVIDEDIAEPDSSQYTIQEDN